MLIALTVYVVPVVPEVFDGCEVPSEEVALVLGLREVAVVHQAVEEGRVVGAEQLLGAVSR